MSEITSTGDFVWTGGDPPLDDHTMNACLARVIGIDIEERVDPDYRTYFVHWRDCGGCHSLQEWNPLGDASQMELVEAWLWENGFWMDWHSWGKENGCVCNVYHPKDNIKGWCGKDPDRKRAFALAIWEMEQSQKETT